MGTFIQFKGDDGPILVDITPAGAGVSAVGVLDPVVKVADESFSEAMRVAGRVASQFRSVIQQYGLDEVELEIGFQFTGKGTIYIVQAEAQAALKMTFTFKSKRPA